MEAETTPAPPATPVDDANTTTPTAETDTQSLAEHEAAFGPARGKSRATPAATTTEPAKAEAEGEGERDAQGRFKNRHRAESQKAKAEDVPRINELTAKLRAAEAERDALKKAPVSSAPPVQPVTPAPPLRKPEAEDVDAQGQPLYKTLSAYMDARDLYNRKLWAAEEQQRAELTRISSSWKSRVDAAMKAHADFEEVALKAPTKIPQGSLADAWILESEDGAEILYALQTDDAERERILAMPPVQQAKALALLGQQLTAPPKPRVTPAHEPAPRPPNPIRTGPIRTADEPPDPATASLADFERAYPRPARRR